MLAHLESAGKFVTFLLSNISPCSVFKSSFGRACLDVEGLKSFSSSLVALRDIGVKSRDETILRLNSKAFEKPFAEICNNYKMALIFTKVYEKLTSAKIFHNFLRIQKMCKLYSLKSLDMAVSHAIYSIA